MRSVVPLLAEARAAEKEQAQFYRALAALAEERGDAALSERLNGLHADEQHHLSRLTARLLEMGEPLQDLEEVRAAAPVLDGWEDAARAREQQEIRRYERLLGHDLDAHTSEVVCDILRAERHHVTDLGGKWTVA